MSRMQSARVSKQLPSFILLAILLFFGTHVSAEEHEHDHKGGHAEAGACKAGSHCDDESTGGEHGDGAHADHKHDGHKEEAPREDGHSEADHKEGGQEDAPHADLKAGGHEEHGHEEGEGHEGIVELDWTVAEKEGVKFVTAGPGEVRNTLSLNGEISLNGDSVVHVSPRFPGVLKRVEKNLGEEVKAGDLLAVIQSNESLSIYEIRAEVAGTIIEKDATRGEFVRDDKNLFTVADLTTVWVNAAVYPDDLKRVGVGSPVIISSRDSTQKGSVSFVRPMVSELTRTGLVRIALRNDEHRWLPGMFVKVRVLLEPFKVAVAIPASAIQLIGNKPVIFVKAMSEDGHPAFRQESVELGRTDDETTEILKGLKPGETVASGNTFILKAELGKGSAEHEH